MRDVKHDIADADDGDTPANREVLPAERRQFVVVVDQVLGVVDAAQVLAGQAQPFGALRAHGDQDGLKAEAAQLVQGQVAIVANRYVAPILNLRQAHQLAKLLAQTFFHFVFVRKDAVFGQAARFDIAVEQHHMRTRHGQLARGKQAGRSGADNSYEILIVNGLQGIPPDRPRVG